MKESQKGISLAAKQASTAGEEHLCIMTACMQTKGMHQARRELGGADVEGDDDMHWALSAAVSDLH